MESLNWKQSVYRDDSIKKTNIREYSPHTGTNLNDAYSDIHIEIQNQDQFLLPGDSYIYILKLNWRANIQSGLTHKKLKITPVIGKVG